LSRLTEPGLPGRLNRIGEFRPVGWQPKQHLIEDESLPQYTDWMKGLFGPLPNGSYEVKSFATDAERNDVTAYGRLFRHSYRPRPVLPTDKSTWTDYVYVMQFTGDKISHMTKIWHSGLALKELGWA
jgi:hypothetical protein